MILKTGSRTVVVNTGWTMSARKASAMARATTKKADALTALYEDAALNSSLGGSFNHDRAFEAHKEASHFNEWAAGKYKVGSVERKNHLAAMDHHDDMLLEHAGFANTKDKLP